MPSRQDRFGYGVTIPATTARVVDTAVEILGDPDPSEMAFLHSVLVQTFLPYRDPKTRDYVRESGRASLVLTAGYLLDPATRSRSCRAYRTAPSHACCWFTCAPRPYAGRPRSYPLRTACRPSCGNLA